jgi:hypothetical protein
MNAFSPLQNLRYTEMIPDIVSWGEHTMTSQEHLLMLTMFARQSQMLEILVTVMKREGMLAGDDIAAFANVVGADAHLTEEIIRSVRDEYKSVATRFGVGVNFKVD